MQLLKICSRSCLIVTLSYNHVQMLHNMTLFIPRRTVHQYAPRFNTLDCLNDSLYMILLIPLHFVSILA